MASLAVAREWQDEVPARWTDNPEPWEDETDAGDATEEDHPEPSPPSAPQRPPKRTAAERDALALAYLRRPQIVKFDTSRHRWREAVCKVLGVECGGDGGAAALAALAPAPLGAGSRGGARGTGTPWIRRWKSRAPDVAAEVIAVYVGFVRDVVHRAGQESEIPNFKGSFLGRFPLVSADFWTSDHLSERSRSVNAFIGTRARGTLTLKRR